LPSPKKVVRDALVAGRSGALGLQKKLTGKHGNDNSQSPVTERLRRTRQDIRQASDRATSLLAELESGGRAGEIEREMKKSEKRWKKLQQREMKEKASRKAGKKQKI
jgi:hypothetical protein